MFSNKPKTVLIVEITFVLIKKEAEQYFEENLSIEVQVLNKKMMKK